MQRARALRQEGNFEEAKQAESRARTAIFRSELNTITAQGAEQKRRNALIAGLGVAPEGLADDQKQAVLAQFQNLGRGAETTQKDQGALDSDLPLSASLKSFFVI